MSATRLPPGLPEPTPDLQGPAAPYWRGLREGRLLVQKCAACGGLQWGPDYICAACHSFDPGWQEVEPRGRIFSWTRVWQGAQPVLKDAVPYLVVLVELAGAPHARLIGNLLGDPMQEVEIGADVVGVFEQHESDVEPYALLQWRLVE